jgi:nitroimidazol reductase NimA-like FMN-containing flavoprotein (pyridoxamine 5'-phosphate oxidase superfamily)
MDRHDAQVSQPEAVPAIDRLPAAVAKPHPTDRHGIEVLTREECIRHLELATVARVGITVDAMPVIVPVNVVLATLDRARGCEVVIRTVDGSKLNAALSHAVVAVEIDQVDPISHEGWSVLVRGRSRTIDTDMELEAASRLPLRPWASEEADRFIAVSVDLVSGREVIPWHVRTRPAVDHAGRS